MAGRPAERPAGAQAKQEVKQLTTKLQSRDLEPQPGRTLMESFEAGVNQVRRSLGAGCRVGAGHSVQPEPCKVPCHQPRASDGTQNL